MTNLLAFGKDVIGGSGSSGGGHIIQNASDIDLTQRDTLQFKGGLKATDDSTNEKTVVDGSPNEITWAEYNAMTPQQQQALEHTLVTNVPSADGTINADLMTKLWENPNPTSSFSGQTVAIDLSDYDAVIVIAGYDNTSSHRNINCFTAFVGSSGTISMTNYAASARQRNFDVATTGIGFTATYLNGSASNTDNTACIPLAIYGIKKTVTVKFDALARDVSTLASNCMLSDGVTSVEYAIDDLTKKQTSSSTKVQITTTAYATEADGYAEFGGGTAETLWRINGLIAVRIPANSSEIQTIYIKKGMTLVRSSGNGTCYFYPLY